MSGTGLQLAVLFLCALVAAPIAQADDPQPSLIFPNGLAIDRDGNLFISDIGAHRIFKLDREQRLTVVAGTSEAGFSGDGGPAKNAQLNAPFDLAFDPEGNLLIADTFNHRIRRLERNGTIATFVGNGKETYSNDESQALNVSLNNPQSLCFGREGNLYITDTYNAVIRRMDRDGKVRVVAGSTSGLAGDGGPATKAQLNLPQAVAIAPDGSIYISDSANSRIRRVSSDGTIQTIAGSGPGSGSGGAGFGGDNGPSERARLFSPGDLKFSPTGHLYISDSGNNRVRLIAHGTIITIAGAGTPGFSGDQAKAVRATLNTPQKLALSPDGSVYIADRVNHAVRKVDSSGMMSTVAGAGISRGIMVDPTVLKRRE